MYFFILRCQLGIIIVDLKDWELWTKHTYAVIQKYHKPNIIKEYDFLRWINKQLYTIFYYFIFKTGFNSLNVFHIKGRKKYCIKITSLNNF